MDDEVLEQMQGIFRDVLDDPNITTRPGTTAADHDAWDSLAHLRLISAIEDEFEIRFALGELQNLRNVGEMINLVAQKKQNRPTN